jgi:Ku protein
MGAMRTVILQLGLVQAQVSILKATDDKDGFTLNQTHNCASKGALYPIEQKLFCSGCKNEVQRADITKAYQPTKGQYIPIGDAELDAIKVATSGLINIEQIVTPLTMLENPVWFDGKSYFLTPPAKEKYPPMGYAAIVEALKGDVGIARTTAYNREWTVLLRVGQHGIVMHQVRYPSELRQEPTVNLPVLDKSYIEIIKTVKENMRVQTPNLDYKDSYGEARAQMVAAKMAGLPAPAPVQTAAPVQSLDLMAQLKAMAAAPKQEQPAAVAQAVEEPKKKGKKGKAA